jgi:hypothetical protein
MAVESRESRFRVARVVVLWEVIEEDEAGRFLASYSGKGQPLSEGDPEGQERSIGERLDLALADYCQTARQEKAAGS